MIFTPILYCKSQIRLHLIPSFLSSIIPDITKFSLCIIQNKCGINMKKVNIAKFSITFYILCLLPCVALQNIPNCLHRQIHRSNFVCTSFQLLSNNLFMRNISCILYLMFQGCLKINSNGANLYLCFL